MIPRVSMLTGVHDRINRGMPPFDGRSISPASSPPKTSKSALTQSKSRYGNISNDKDAISMSSALPKSTLKKKQSSSKTSLGEQVNIIGNARPKSAGDKRNTTSSARPGTFTHMPTMRSIYASEKKKYVSSSSGGDGIGRYASRSKSRSLFESEQYEQNDPLAKDIHELVDPLNDSAAQDIFNQ